MDYSQVFPMVLVSGTLKLGGALNWSFLYLSTRPDQTCNLIFHHSSEGCYKCFIFSLSLIVVISHFNYPLDLMRTIISYRPYARRSSSLLCVTKMRMRSSGRKTLMSTSAWSSVSTQTLPSDIIPLNIFPGLMTQTYNKHLNRAKCQMWLSAEIGSISTTCIWNT